MPYSVISLERGTITNRRVGALTGAVTLAEVGTTIDPFFSGQETATEPYAEDASGLWSPLGTPWTSKTEGNIHWDANSGADLGIQTKVPWLVAGMSLDVIIRLRQALPSDVNVNIVYGKSLGLGVSLDQVILASILVPAGTLLAKTSIPVVDPAGGPAGADAMLGYVIYTDGTPVTFPVEIESAYARVTTGSNLQTSNAFFDGATGWNKTTPATITNNCFGLGKKAPLKTYLTQVLPAGADKAQFWCVRFYCKQTGGGLKVRVGLSGTKFPIKAGWNMFRAITYDTAPGIELQILKDEAGDGVTDTIIDCVFAWYAVVQGEVLSINPLDGTVIDTLLAGDPGQVVGPCQICWGDSMPVGGTYQAGDIIYNLAPASGGPSGWLCMKDGNPGLWTTLPEMVA